MLFHKTILESTFMKNNLGSKIIPLALNKLIQFGYYLKFWVDIFINK